MSNNLLAPIPGVYIAKALQTLPPAQDVEDRAGSVAR